MTLSIASWNINGVKARLETALAWLESREPDLVALQEIKSVDENFPREQFERLGYNVYTHGQKSFNGVALLSKTPLEDVSNGLKGDDEDIQARFIEGRYIGDNSSLRVMGIYLPNGNPVDGEKFPYKLRWMDRLIAHAEQALKLEEPFIILGDYNIIPSKHDVHAPENWWGDALYRPESLEKFRKLKNLGLYDAFEAADGRPHSYSFWDYQAGAWNKNHGIRIDHILMSPAAADLLETCWIDKEIRGEEKPSDHVPVCAKFML